MLTYVTIAVVFGFATAKPASAANAIFDALITRGVKLSPDYTLILAKPAMDDGVDAGRQRAIVEVLIHGRYDWGAFTRKSVVSPFLLKISEGAAESGPVLRNIDLYFVAFGPLSKLSSEDYLHQQLSLAATNSSSDESSNAKVLTSDELKQRGIVLEQKPDDPRWVAVTSTLLGKVRVRVTTENIKSETKDSIVVASVTDPRFLRDAQYPNSWQSLTVDDAGHRQLGPPEPYVGLGSYVKGTQLSDPAGAIFIEYHVAFVEPQGWFHGTNLLRSKLPIVAQEMVRKFRRSMAE